MSKKPAKSKDLTEVQEHYQDYPYPFRDPEEEKKRLLSIMGEYLGELNHYLYKGKENFKKDFRVLIAGGGTGDSAVYMAEQLKNTNAEVVYLDFSNPSMEIAKKRAANRGLKNITWVLDSILNIPKLKLGKFDFINCSGVLHHLQSPPEGLANLKDSLNERGGMNIMVYGKYGRTGVYHIQDIMKMVNQGVTNRIEEVMNAKQIINNLPSTNWYVRAQELLGDHIHFGDVGLYDMFLHKQDRAYSIPELNEFISDAGLNFIEFSVVSDRIALRIENYVKDFSLCQKIKKMDIITQQAICELLVGNMIKHTVYVSNKKDTVATLNDLNNIPYFYTMVKTPETLCDLMDSTGVTPGQYFSTTLNTQVLKNANISILVSGFTKSVFKNMVGEDKTLKEIFDGVRADLKQDIQDDVLIDEVNRIFTPFIITGVMLLRDKSVPLL